MARQLTIALAVGVILGFGAAHTLSNVEASPPATEIHTENGVIRFVVDGQEQARIDAVGFTVRGNLSYSGAFIDSVVYPSSRIPTAGETP